MSGKKLPLMQKNRAKLNKNTIYFEIPEEKIILGSGHNPAILVGLSGYDKLKTQN
jgi:hypothetical protein